jgi:hypothetical protein
MKVAYIFRATVEENRKIKFTRRNGKLLFFDSYHKISCIENVFIIASVKIAEFYIFRQTAEKLVPGFRICMTSLIWLPLTFVRLILAY